MCAVFQISFVTAEIGVFEVPGGDIEVLYGVERDLNADVFASKNKQTQISWEIVPNPFPGIFLGKVIDIKKVLIANGIALLENDRAYYFFDKRVIVIDSNLKNLEIVESLFRSEADHYPRNIKYTFTFRSKKLEEVEQIHRIEGFLRSGEKAKMVSRHCDVILECLVSRVKCNTSE